MSRKIQFFCCLFIFLACIIEADELADLLQDLAIQTACLGMYSSTEAGIRDYLTNRFIDPPDWYTPPMMANRFANMSGTMTRTVTFYGVCFDYAQFAWDDIKKYQTKYNKAGMKDSQWYIAVTNRGDPNTIYLYDPVSPDRATNILNGIHVRENSRHRVRAHDDAAGHAWLWVQHKNGTWYWIDPTWTDNTGYPWWGIVQGGREVQYYPNANYSIAANFPQPPSQNETQAKREARSPNSTYVSYSGNPTYYSDNYNPFKSNYLTLGYNYTLGLPIGFTIADSMFFEKSLIYISANFVSNGTIFEDIHHIEWIYGLSISVTDFLRIPIGLGGNHTRIDDSEKWEDKFVLEIGLQPVIFERVYLSATYRLRGFETSGFTIGAGIVIKNYR